MQLNEVTVLRRRNGAPVTPPGGATGGSLLCVANFAANTGYAWDFIESLYAQVADRLSERGVRTWVAYPRIAAAPATLRGSTAQAVELDVSFSSFAKLARVISFVRQHDVRAVYLCDRGSWHPAYLALRLAGVRRIVLHDHTSGERTVARGLKRLLKQARLLIPGMLADVTIAVSDYVAARKVAVELLPRTHVKRIWNSICDPGISAGAAARLREEFDIAAGTAVVVCACRATPEKGVATLLKAFDRLHESIAGSQDGPALVYMGDGPALPELKALRDTLKSRDQIILAGYRADAAELLGGADVCVVPSLWEEAFGLAALEPMMRGVPVVASRSGGIPEVIGDNEGGRLVEPGDEEMLAAAIRELLANPEERHRIGQNGRARAVRLFTRESQINRLCALLEAAFA